MLFCGYCNQLSNSDVMSNSNLHSTKSDSQLCKLYFRVVNYFRIRRAELHAGTNGVHSIDWQAEIGIHRLQLGRTPCLAQEHRANQPNNQ